MRASSLTVAVFSAFAVLAWGCVGEDAGPTLGTSPEAGPPGPSENGGDGGPGTPDVDVDAGADAEAGPPPECDLAKPFGAAVPVGGVNDGTADDQHAVLTDDELTIYFGSNRQGPSTVFHLFSSTRASRAVAFPTPTVVQGTFTADGEDHPGVSGDGKTLVFDSFRPATGGGVLHLWMTTRMSTTVAFGTPTQITAAGSSLRTPSLTANGEGLYAENLSNGGVVRMTKNGATYTTVTPLLNVGSPNTELEPYSRDDLTLYTTLGGNVQTHARASTTVAFSGASELAGVNTNGTDAPSWLSPNGCRLYLTHADPGGDRDIYVATRPQ